jgi:DNA repair protein RecO
MFTTDAIILTTGNIGEHDKTASLYARKFGKIRVIAKGSRELTTKQGNFLHSFAVCECSFVSGRNGYILTGIQNKKFFPELNVNLFAMGYITAFFNLVDDITYECQRDMAIWELLINSLETAEHITKQKIDIAGSLWQKEKLWVVELLDVLGLRPPNLHLEKIHSQKDLDIYLKNLLKNKLEQRVRFFCS